MHCFAILDSGYRDNEDEKDKPVAIAPNCRDNRAFLHSRAGTGMQRPEYAINPCPFSCYARQSLMLFLLTLYSVYAI